MIQSLQIHDLPCIKNIISFTIDEVSFMIVVNLLEKNIPYIFTIRCICHSLVLYLMLEKNYLKR